MRVRGHHLAALVAATLVLGACGPHVIRAPEEQRSEGPRSEGPHRVRVRRLLVAYAGATGAGSAVTRDREEARERAAMIAGMAREGQLSFRELVTEYGDPPPDDDDRNRIRLVLPSTQDLSEVEVETALELRVGQVSSPVETTAGYVLLLRESDEDAPEQLTSIGARHILIQFAGAEGAARTVTRSREDALALAHQIAEAARAEDADWRALHQEYSDEEGHNGGDLGIFGRGEMVPAFERAAFRLDVDEISEPIESQFGFHIIQRTR